MLNIVILAALSVAECISTNANDIWDLRGFALTNAAIAADSVRNMAVVSHELTCPHCGKVSTNLVDVTFLHEHYERMERRRLSQDALLIAQAYKEGVRARIAETLGEEPFGATCESVVTNWFPISRFDMLHWSVGREHPDVRMDEPLYIRSVVTNIVVKGASR